MEVQDQLVQDHLAQNPVVALGQPVLGVAQDHLDQDQLQAQEVARDHPVLVLGQLAVTLTVDQDHQEARIQLIQEVDQDLQILDHQALVDLDHRN